MGAVVVVVGLEIEQFVLQICARPEQCMVQTLASNSADEPFDEGMRQWNVGDGLDYCHFHDPQIGFPLVEPIKRIVVRAQILRQPAMPSKGVVEHAEQCWRRAAKSRPRSISCARRFRRIIARGRRCNRIHCWRVCASLWTLCPQRGKESLDMVIITLFLKIQNFCTRYGSLKRMALYRSDDRSAGCAGFLDFRRKCPANYLGAGFSSLVN
jgi:hypothetical protein